MNPQDFIGLEAMVDSYGLEGVLFALSDICSEKADHVQTNWQDNALAKQWKRRRTACNKAGDTVKAIQVC